MRGAESGQAALFSYVDLERRVPADHPLRAMKALVEPVLAALSPRFDAIYASAGRPSIPPEQLLRALLLQVLYTIRSERQLMEQLDYNLLFRWFVGLGMDGAVWHPTTFTQNRDRLLQGAIAEGFFAGVVRLAEAKGLLSKEHFTVDGTLLEAWASHKSVRPKGEATDRTKGGGGSGGSNPSVDFRKEARTNATHASVTDPDARLAKKAVGKEAKLCYQASALVDNRHGLAVATAVGHATGTAEVEQATGMLLGVATARPAHLPRGTVGADRKYDTKAFVAALRHLGYAPHVARNATCRHPSAIDGRTTRHPGYAESQRRRKRIEEGFGWGKTVGPLRKLKHRGVALVDWVFTFTMAAYDLVRIRTLQRAGVCA